MAWDTERTKRVLLAAAVDEFAERGLAGARVDRIAAAAGINKERIYQYFGNKAGLFDAVLLFELDRLADAVPLSATSPDDLVNYAGAVFDHYQQRPHLARLLHWEGLERGRVPGLDETDRARRYRDKVGAIAEGLPTGTGDNPVSAGDVLLAIITLATAWHVLPQLHQMILGAAATDIRRRRAALTASVRSLVNAGR